MAMLGFCQGDIRPPQVTSNSGEIIAVDAEKSTVGLRQRPTADPNLFFDVVLAVPPAARILKGNVDVKLSELKVGDQVMVRCVTDSVGRLTVESITVQAKELTPAVRQ